MRCSVTLIRLPPHSLVGTFPRGDGENVVCFCSAYNPKNILIPIGFYDNEKHKTLAFPAGEGVASSCGGDG